MVLPACISKCHARWQHPAGIPTVGCDKEVNHAAWCARHNLSSALEFSYLICNSRTTEYSCAVQAHWLSKPLDFLCKDTESLLAIKQVKNSNQPRQLDTLCCSVCKFYASRLTLLICCTSSRVGAMISPTGPSPCASGGWSLTWRSIGSTNASVLPEPVLAMPIQSLQLTITSCSHTITSQSLQLFKTGLTESMLSFSHIYHRSRGHCQSCPTCTVVMACQILQ